MKRSGLLYRQTTNRLLDLVSSGSRRPYPLEPEVGLAGRLGVSRSTVRKAIQRLEKLGIVKINGRSKTVVRKPAKRDYFQVEQDAAASNEVAERFILSKLASRELRPENRFSELELARESGCNRAAIREALIRVSRFGLIEKTPRQQWHVIALDEEVIDELIQMRELLESFALGQILRLARRHGTWERLQALLQEHKAYDRKRDKGAVKFQDMDKRLHRALLSSCDNRYIDSFFAVCAFFIDYQLRPKELMASRVDLAVAQHVKILNALLKRNEQGALRALRIHMRTVRQFLLETAGLYS